MLPLRTGLLAGPAAQRLALPRCRLTSQAAPPGLPGRPGARVGQDLCSALRLIVNARKSLTKLPLCV